MYKLQIATRTFFHRLHENRNIKLNTLPFFFRGHVKTNKKRRYINRVRILSLKVFTQVRDKITVLDRMSC